MYRFLLSRQWVLLTALALVLIPAMVQAGFWQLHRHQERVERNELIAASLAAPAMPVAEVAPPGGTVDPADRYRTVTATGVYDAAGEAVARQRTGPDGGGMGYYVLTPLVRPDGTAVLVNRGWVPAGSDPGQYPEVPDPPGGEVTVTGRLMTDETPESTGIRERSGLPDGMVMLINSRQRAEDLDRTFLPGHLELSGTSPEPPAGADAPRTLPEPGHRGIGAHFAYALQWWLFAAGVPVGWFLLVRREAQDRRAARPSGEDGVSGDRTATARTAAPA